MLICHSSAENFFLPFDQFHVCLVCRDHVCLVCRGHVCRVCRDHVFLVCRDHVCRVCRGHVCRVCRGHVCLSKSFIGFLAMLRQMYLQRGPRLRKMNPPRIKRIERIEPWQWPSEEISNALFIKSGCTTKL